MTTEARGIRRRLPIEVTDSLRRRFWAGVEKGEPDDCWPWTGCKRGNDYGCIKYRGRVLSAHRVSFVLHHGEIPNGHIVCHSCDNRQCVNPAHLSAGTYRQNVLEMHERGLANTPRGEQIPWSVLTEDIVREAWAIRERTGFGCRRIGRMLGVSHAALKSVFAGKSWRHVEPRLNLAEAQA